MKTAAAGVDEDEDEDDEDDDDDDDEEEDDDEEGVPAAVWASLSARATTEAYTPATILMHDSASVSGASG